MPTLNFKGKTTVETYHYTVPHYTLEFDEKLSVLTQPQFKEWIGKTVGKEGEDATGHDPWCRTDRILRRLLASDYRCGSATPDSAVRKDVQ